MLKPAPLRLFLVRHGEAAANIGMRYLGSQDDALTERGVWQAAQLGRALGRLPLVAVYASPLRRAADTAAPLAHSLGLAVTSDVRLREGAFGTWEGMSRPEVLARSPEDRALLARFESDPTVAPPQGESLAQVQARALELVGELAAHHAGQWVALVSHVGPIKALLCAALGVPLAAARRMFLDPATVSVVDWGEPPVVRLFNAHHHLGEDAARWMNPGH